MHVQENSQMQPAERVGVSVSSGVVQEVLDTSSPKRREYRKLPRLGRSMRANDNDNENEDENDANDNVLVGYESSEVEEVVERDAGGNTIETLDAAASKVSERITSFGSYRNDGSIDTREQRDVDQPVEVRHDGVIDNVTSPFEEEVTVQQVKEFIANRKKQMEARKAERQSRRHATSVPSTQQELPSQQRQVQRQRQDVIPVLSKPNKHKRVLRRLIHNIHEKSYNSQWDVEEWQLFQKYLNEWKLSDDDNMVEPEVLEKLFNCSMEELEIRIKSLRNFAHWKRMKMRNREALVPLMVDG
jgi:DNA primase